MERPCRAFRRSRRGVNSREGRGCTRRDWSQFQIRRIVERGLRPTALGGGDSVLLPRHSTLDQLFIGDTTPTAIHPAFGTSVRAVGNIADAEASLHNSSEQDADSALPTAASKSIPVRIARRECSGARPISIDAEPVVGCAAGEDRADWSAQGTSSDRQETSQLPTADDIKDTERTMKLAKPRLIGAQELCSLGNISFSPQSNTH